MTAHVRRAAVLGHPIAHSLSPVLHRAAYSGLGLGWSYGAYDVDETALAGFLEQCGPQWAGLSLTMPLKRVVLPLLDTRTDLVDLVGSANTVVLGPDGRAGHNTDVAGMVAALRSVGAGAVAGPAAVLGGGATAASALAALHELGCPNVALYARRPAAAGRLREVAQRLEIGLQIEPWPQRLPDRDEAAIVVSTVPAAAGARLAAVVPAAAGWLLDVSYDPWPPPLVGAWTAAGGSAVAGDEMLLHQAAEQVHLMTGAVPDLTSMRRALHEALVRRRAAQATSPR